MEEIEFEAGALQICEHQLEGRGWWAGVGLGDAFGLEIDHLGALGAEGLRSKLLGSFVLALYSLHSQLHHAQCPLYSQSHYAHCTRFSISLYSLLTHQLSFRSCRSLGLSLQEKYRL